MNANEIEVAGGILTVTPTDGFHIHVSTEPQHKETFKPVILNGTAYYVSAHLWRNGSSAWGLADPGKGSLCDGSPRKSIHLSRADGSGKDPTDAAFNKVAPLIVAAVNAWVIANPSMIEEAEAAYVNQAIEARLGLITKARTAIADMTREIWALQQGEHLPPYSQWSISKKDT